MRSAADTSSQCLGNTADVRCTLDVGLYQKDRQLGQQTAIGLLAYGSPPARTPARPPLPIRRQHRHHRDRDLTSKTDRRWRCKTKTRSGRQVERRLSDRLRDLHRGDLQRARCAETGHSRDDTKTLSRFGLSWALCFGADRSFSRSRDWKTALQSSRDLF